MPFSALDGVQPLWDKDGVEEVGPEYYLDSLNSI
jgi:hypothetical protein